MIDTSPTYSELMRQVGRDAPELLGEFRRTFKQAFDRALLDESPDPAGIALAEAARFLAHAERDAKLASKHAMLKTAAELGNPDVVGEYLANLVRFMLRKISDQNRPRSIARLRHKISLLSPHELASKKMPPSATMGQSLTVIKHLMFGKNPTYIREVLNSITRRL